ncbi:MAG: hypothetical protein Crog4KO_01070 [Crocinitomicaceae bacterium]
MILTSDITALNEHSLNEHGVLWSVCVVTFIFSAPVAFYYSYSYLKLRRWENSFLKRSSDRDDHNFAIAYIVLIGMLLKQDPREYASKSYFLERILERLSVDSIDVEGMFKRIHEKDVRVKHIAKWTNARLTSVEREELMYALIEIVYMDETLVRKEMSLLLDFVKYTDIDKKQLDSMMASHKQRLAREAEERRRRQKKQRKQIPTKTRRERAAEILGISPFAAAEEIKKAYRELAKRHHPDRFHGDSPSMQEVAKARFIEIQKAYELLEE